MRCRPFASLPVWYIPHIQSRLTHLRRLGYYPKIPQAVVEAKMKGNKTQGISHFFFRNSHLYIEINN